MGMDIYGLNPVVTSEKPAEIDWNTSSDEQKDAYFKARNKWEEENPGTYFRANLWSWRPIHMLSMIASNDANLNIDFSGWATNDGNGLADPEMCNRLADAIEGIINRMEDSNMKDDDDRIQLCMGMWVTDSGHFYHDEDDELNKNYPPGTIEFTPIVTAKGKVVTSAHSTELWHIKKWTNFLRTCGGFEIF